MTNDYDENEDEGHYSSTKALLFINETQWYTVKLGDDRKPEFIFYKKLIFIRGHDRYYFDQEDAMVIKYLKTDKKPSKVSDIFRIDDDTKLTLTTTNRW